MLNLLLDVDDVLGFTIDHLLSIYNKENNTEVIREYITDWGFKNCKGIDEKALSIFGYKDFFKNIPPDPEAIEGVNILLDEGYPIFILTAPPDEREDIPTLVNCMPRILSDKAEWVNTHFPRIPKNNYIFCFRKDMVGNSNSVTLDDKILNLVGSPCKYKICMDRPWNRVHNHPEAKPFERVFSFLEFVDDVRMLNLGEELRRKENA